MMSPIACKRATLGTHQQDWHQQQHHIYAGSTGPSNTELKSILLHCVCLRPLACQPDQHERNCVARPALLQQMRCLGSCSWYWFGDQFQTIKFGVIGVGVVL